MTKQSTSLILNNLPPKYKDPGSPTISIVVWNSKLGHALVDLGANVNLLPYSVYVGPRVRRIRANQYHPPIS